MSVAGRNAASARLGVAVARPSSAARIGDFVAPTKPRVVSLVVFTALVGFLVAPGHRDALAGCIALLCITAGAAGAGALNIWHDANVDALMTRTAGRPIPRGRVPRAAALALGLGLAAGSVVVLGLLCNLAAAGAFPPVIGWVAATGRIGVEPLLPFLIICLWTPPHFWALSLNRTGEYARADVPMLPVVAGKPETKRKILIYGVLLAPTAALLWAFGLAGTIYGSIAGICGAVMILLALQLLGSRSGTEAISARRLFAFSILYLFLLFAALLADTAAIHGQPFISLCMSGAGCADPRCEDGTGMMRGAAPGKLRSSVWISRKRTGRQ